MILTVEEARRLAAASMEAVGHTKAEADIIADHLVDCELRGLTFGGLPRALSIVERIQGTSERRRPITLIKESPVSASLDGGDQVGYLVALKAMEIALEKAKVSGLAVVGAYDTWYTGMYSYYLERITQAGFAGMIAGSAPQKVAPHGGVQPRFGTNPIAFGFPSADAPVIWDIGTSSIMAGEVALAARLGQQLREGSAYDKDGEPTRDPLAAATGAWTVWGGHKGSGLAVAVQLLGMMTGASADPKGVRDCGFFLFVVNPNLFDHGETYPARVAAYAESLRGTKPIDPTQPVRVPFERSQQTRADRSKADSIEVADEVFSALTKIQCLETHH